MNHVRPASTMAWKSSPSSAREPAFPWLRLAAVLNTVSAPILPAVLWCAGVRAAPLDLTSLVLEKATDPSRRRGTPPVAGSGLNAVP